MMFYLDTFLAEAEESSSGVDLLLPATSELVAGVVAFAVVFFFVWKWALPAMNETLDKRSAEIEGQIKDCLLYTSPSPRDMWTSRMPSSA